MTGLVAAAETLVSAPPSDVWRALTDADQLREYMFGSEVESDWQPGSPITWRGVYEGKPYEDKGEVLEADPDHRLVLTHFSPLGGKEDVPANYHTLTYELSPRGEGTHLTLSQDGNTSEDEVAHSRQMWEGMLSALKAVVEGRQGGVGSAGR